MFDGSGFTDKKKEAVDKIRVAWIATLPDSVGGFKIDKLYKQFVDNQGNRLFGLPVTPVTLAELEEFARNEWADMSDFME